MSALKDQYAAREAAAKVAIEAIAELWRVEGMIRTSEADADLILRNVTPFIPPMQQRAWLESLRLRAGLPAHHAYAGKASNDAERVGLTAVRGITSGVITPGAIGLNGVTIQI